MATVTYKSRNAFVYPYTRDAMPTLEVAIEEALDRLEPEITQTGWVDLSDEEKTRALGL